MQTFIIFSHAMQTLTLQYNRSSRYWHDAAAAADSYDADVGLFHCRAAATLRVVTAFRNDATVRAISLTPGI